MARTIMEIDLKGLTVDNALIIIKTQMSVNNFTKKLVKGEEVWSKGDGVLIPLQCFNCYFKENSVVIQAWVRDMLLGESNIDGFGRPKKKMRAILNDITNKIKYH